MTAIAWDGKTLAADRRATDEYGRFTEATKIGRSGTALWAISGNQSNALEMLAWWTAGAHSETFPSAARDAKATLIIVLPDGTVHVYNNGPYPAMDTQSAWGSSYELLWMAMRCGKSAAEAVLLAAEKSAYCGNGVDTLEFDQ